MRSSPDDHPDRAAALDEFARRAAAAVHDDTAVLDAAAVQLFDAFGRAGIDALLLKGPVLARVLYEGQERRTYVDIDVLIAPRHRESGREALRGLGYAVSPEVFAVDDVGRVVHSETWVGKPPFAERELAIDVHFWLAGARADPQVVWDRLAMPYDEIKIGGRSIPVPRREALALHIGMHAAQHGPSYAKGTRDLELALEAWPDDVWQAAAGLATDIGASDFFAGGLRIIGAGAELAARLDLEANPALDWEIRNPDARPRGRFHLDALQDAASFGERVAILRRALLPTPEWLVRDYPWAWRGGLWLRTAQVLHVIRAPLWALRAIRFRRRAGRQTDA